MEERSVIRSVPSGTVDIVWNGVFNRMEFNCGCLDALPLCKGMCCRNRSGYSVELTEEEIITKGYIFREHPTQKGVWTLGANKNNTACYYFDEETSKCKIHADRPKMCRQWHCSPAGQLDDKEIERRDAGWMLMPVRKEEAEFLRRTS